MLHDACSPFIVACKAFECPQFLQKLKTVFLLSKYNTVMVKLYTYDMQTYTGEIMYVCVFFFFRPR